MFGFGEDDNGYQPQEKSFLSRVFSFVTKALMAVALFALSVVTLTLFSDKARDTLDDLTKDKDGKGGWGSKIREAVSGDKDRTPLDSVKDLAKDGYNKATQFFTSEEDKGITAGDIATTGAGAYVATKVLKKRGSIGEDGKFEATPSAQAKAEQAVAKATEAREKLIAAEKEAAKRAEQLKVAKDLEDKEGKWRLRSTPTARDYKQAEKDLAKIRKSLEKYDSIIEAGKKALDGTTPSTTTRGQALWNKYLRRFGKSAEAATHSEIKLLERYADTTAKPAAHTATTATPAAEAVAAKPVTPPSAGESVIRAKVTEIIPPPSPQPPPPATPPSTINTSSSTLPETIAVKPPVPPTATTGETTALTKTGVFSSVTNGIKGVFAPLAPIIEPIAPILEFGGKLLGYTGAAAAATEGGIHTKDLWQKKDKDGDFISRDSAVAQGIGTVMESGGMAASVFMKTPLPFLAGTAAKDITYTANVIGTGNNPEVTKSAASSLVEWVGRKIGADKPVNYMLDKTVGEKYDSEQDAVNRQKKKIEDDKAAADKIKSLPEDKQAIIKAWQEKANADGLYKINPLGLIDHVASHNWQMPPQTPKQATTQTEQKQ